MLAAKETGLRVAPIVWLLCERLRSELQNKLAKRMTALICLMLHLDGETHCGVITKYVLAAARAKPGLIPLDLENHAVSELTSIHRSIEFPGQLSEEEAMELCLGCAKDACDVHKN